MHAAYEYHSTCSGLIMHACIALLKAKPIAGGHIIIIKILTSILRIYLCSLCAPTWYDIKAH